MCVTLELWAIKNMKMLKFTFIFALSILQTGCFTPKLWDSTNTESYIEVNPSEVSIKELESKGIEYWQAPKSGRLFIEKNSIRKLRDWTIRMFASPVTVTLDAATIVVIGAAGLTYVSVHSIALEVQKDPDKARGGLCKIFSAKLKVKPESLRVRI